MKRSRLRLLAAITLAAPFPAAAQGMAVHDKAGLLQQIQAVRQAIQIVAQGKAQLAEAQKLYQDLNKFTDIPRMAQQLKSDALRELDVSGPSLQGFGNGDLNVVGAVRGKADQVYRALLQKLGATGSDQSRAEFDLDARNIGIQTALADSIGGSATSRATGLTQLRDRLASAGTAKEVADLSARFELESAAMQNDQLRLQAIAMQQRASERARAVEGQAALEQKMRDAARYYRGER